MEPGFSNVLKKKSNLLTRNNIGQRFGAPDPNFVKNAPWRGGLEKIMIKGAQSNLGLIHGRGSVGFFSAKEEEIFAELILRNGARI